jgi:16S rRNA (guanine1516-N2)-methyltransferase
VPSDLPVLRVVADPGHEVRAHALATRLGARYGVGPARFELHVGAGGLGVRAAAGDDAGAPPLVLDLAARRPGGEAIVRAVRGRRAARDLRVVDATAGLGGDAAALLRAGLRVTLIERDPLLAVLLEDALTRWGEVEDEEEAARARAATLRIGDARVLLERLRPPPDVVYLDPMYPRLRGGAKRRAAAWLRAWTGERAADAEDEDRELLAAARAVARRRVVVKRPGKAPPLAPGVSGALRGSTTRFDLYAPAPWADRPGDAPR